MNRIHIPPFGDSPNKGYLRLNAIQFNTSPTNSQKMDQNLHNQSSSSTNSNQSEQKAAIPNLPPFSNAARAQLWMLMLNNNKNNSFIVRSDREIEQVVLDLPNQNVLRNDCARTRGSSFTNKLGVNLEKLLTFYCKRENISYKQGMHELAAPFVYFLESEISLSESYNLFALFVERFLPNLYIEKEFTGLQCCLKVLSLLLKYHDIGLYTYLTENYFTPEIYATPWFLTLFSSKLKLDIVYLLWDLYLEEQDPYFGLFVAVGLLIENRSYIMGSDHANVPEILSNLTIQNHIQLKQVYKRAKKVKFNTPLSFTKKLDEFEIFKKGHWKDKTLKVRMRHSLDYLDRLNCMMLSPYELLQALYPIEAGCPNPTCTQSVNKKRDRANSHTTENPLTIDQNGVKKLPIQLLFTDKNGSLAKEISHEQLFPCSICCTKSSSPSRLIFEKSMPHLSEFLKEKAETQINQNSKGYHINFVIMDLRPNKEAGYLPRSHLINTSRLRYDSMNSMVDEFLKLKGLCHFVLMTSKYDSQSMRQKSEENIISDRDRGATDEDNLVGKFLSVLAKKNFQNVSILEGGFDGISQILNKMSIEFLNFKSWTPKNSTKIGSYTEIKDSPSYTNRQINETEGKGTFSDRMNVLAMLKSMGKGGSPKALLKTQPHQEGLTPEMMAAIKNTEQADEYSTPADMLDVPIASLPYHSQQMNQSLLKIQKVSRSKSLAKPHDISINNHNKEDLVDSPLLSGVSQAKSTILSNKEVEGGRILSKLSSTLSPIKSDFKYRYSEKGYVFQKGIEGLQNYDSRDGFDVPKLEITGSDIEPFAASREIFRQKTRSATVNANSGSISPSVYSNGTLSPMKIQAKGSFTPSATPMSRDTPKDAFSTIEKSPAARNSHLVNHSGDTPFGPSIIMNSWGLNYSKVQMSNLDKDPKNLDTNVSMHKTDREFITDRGELTMSKKLSDQSISSNPSTQRQNPLSYSFIPLEVPFQNPNITMNKMLPKFKSTEEFNAHIIQNTASSAKNKDQSLLRQQSQEKVRQEEKNSFYKVHRFEDSQNNSNFGASGIVYKSKETKTIEKTPKAHNGKMINLSMNHDLYPGEILKKNGIARKESMETSIREGNYQSLYNKNGRHSHNPNMDNSMQNDSLYNQSYVSSQVDIQSKAKLLSPTLKRGADDNNNFFYKYYENRNFSFFVCDQVYEQAYPQLSKGILLISDDLVICVAYNNQLLRNITMLQKGTPLNQINSAQKRDSQVIGPGGYLKKLSMDSNADRQQQKEIILLSAFPTKFLLRVTSKKVDPKSISLYFKLPRSEEESFKRFNRLVDLMNPDIQTLYHLLGEREFKRILQDIGESRDAKKFMEEKFIYNMENEKSAEECIKQIKGAYKNCTL